MLLTKYNNSFNIFSRNKKCCLYSSSSSSSFYKKKNNSLSFRNIYYMTFNSSCQKDKRLYSSISSSSAKSSETLNLQTLISVVKKDKELEDGSVIFFHHYTQNYVPPPPDIPRVSFTSEQISEIRRLREEDMQKWTLSVLAQKFQCEPLEIAKVAPLTPNQRERLNHILAEQRIERELGPRRRKRKTGMGQHQLMKMNRHRFKEILDEAGGLKKLMVTQNVVPIPSKKAQGKRRMLREKTKRLDPKLLPFSASEIKAKEKQFNDQLDALINKK